MLLLYPGELYRLLGASSYLILNEIKVFLNRNGLLFKKVTSKSLSKYLMNTIEFNKHDVNIFINGMWQKYAGNIG